MTAPGPPAPAPVISVRDLHKTYGAVRAVDGISFDVAEGEVVAILGPNGAGKTTTVEILEGFRPPSAGTVRVLGEDPARPSPGWRAKLGIVLQSCGIEDELRIEEVLRLHAGYYPAPRPIDEILGLVGLEEHRRRRVSRLSGGQQRRVDLALGLIGDPQLLFLDEPTTGFDPSARRAAWSVVRGLCSLGKTVVLTTHYLDEAQELADRIIIVANGRIVAEGTPDTLGDRGRAAARVQFTIPDGMDLDGLRSLLEPFGARFEGGGCSFESADPAGAVAVAAGWAAQRGTTLAGLSVTRPTLEDIYLGLTEGGTASGLSGLSAPAPPMAPAPRPARPTVTAATPPPPPPPPPSPSPTPTPSPTSFRRPWYRAVDPADALRSGPGPGGGVITLHGLAAVARTVPELAELYRADPLLGAADPAASTVVLRVDGDGQIGAVLFGVPHEALPSLYVVRPSVPDLGEADEATARRQRGAWEALCHTAAVRGATCMVLDVAPLPAPALEALRALSFADPAGGKGPDGDGGTGACGAVSGAGDQRSDAMPAAMADS